MHPFSSRIRHSLTVSRLRPSRVFGWLGAIFVTAGLLLSSRSAAAQTLTLSADVGSVPTAGSSTFVSGSSVYQLSGTGVGLADSADAFHFAYSQVLSGDGQVIVRLGSADATAQSALVLRESLDAGARCAVVAVSGTNARFVRRLSTNGAYVSGDNGNGALAAPAPCWLKLVRSGDTLSGFVSANGQSWSALGSDSLSLASVSTYVGVAVSNGSASNASTGNAAFDNCQSTFLPNKGLQLWLKGDAGVTRDTNGLVSLWADQSGNGNDAAQSTATSEPLLVPAGINGQPTIRFDGSASYLQLPSGFSDFTQGITTLLVTKAASNAYYARFFDLSNGSGQQNLLLARLSTSDGIGFYCQNSSFEADTTAGLTLNQAELLEAEQDPAVQKATVYRNGTALGSTAAGSIVNVTRAVNYIGRGTDGVPFFAGDFAEMVVFNHALTDDERHVWEAYLNAKYQYNPPPAAPMQVSVSALSSTQTSVAWTEASSSVTGYTIERQNANGSWSIIATPGAGSTTYFDSGLLPGTSYTYRVTASNAAGSSPVSTAASGTTDAAGTAPATFPTSGLQLWLRADSGVSTDANAGVTAWTDQAGRALVTQANAGSRPALVANDVNGFPALRFDGGADYLDSNLTAAGGQEVSIFAVMKGTQYLSLVRFQAPGSGDYLIYPWSSAEVFIDSTDGGTSAGMTTGLMHGEWNIGEVTYKTGGTMATFCNGMPVASRAAGGAPLPAGMPLSIGRYSGGGEYLQADVAEILIYNRALGDTERAAVEAYLNAKYAVVAAPGAPAALSGGAISSSQANLFWQPPTRGGIPQGFSLERKAAGGGDFAEVAAIAGGQVGAYIDEQLSPSASYTYRVRAYNAAGYSGYSAETMVTLPAANAAAASLPDIDSLTLWLRPDAGVTKDVNGMVTAWNDASGHGNDAVAALPANEPQWLDGVLNGWPILRFDGVANSLRVPVPVVSTPGNATVLAVVRLPDASTRGPFVEVGYGGGFGVGVGGGTLDDNGNNLIGIYDYVRWIGTGHPLGVGAALAEMTVDGAGTATFYRNGISQGVFPGGGPTTPSQATLIGGSSFGSRYFRGDIAEALVFDHVLSDADRQAWESYLNAKYNYDPVPTAPTQLVATPFSGSQAALNWVDTFQNISGYRVEQQNADGSWSVVANVTAGTTTYLLSGLLPGTQYALRVIATNRTGDSPVSTVSLSTPASGDALPVGDLRLWLRADSGPIADGTGGVSQWLDRSGFSNHALQSDAGKLPRMGVDSASGLPVLHFDGSTSEMSLPNFLASAGAGEIFIVQRASANPNGADAQGSHDFGGDSPYGSKSYPSADGRIVDNFGSNATRDTGAPPFDLHQLHLYDALSQTGEWTSRLNGVLHATASDNTVAFSTAPRLGVSGAYNRHFAGDVAEILVFDRALTSTEREAVGRYLTGRYSLVTAPATPSGVRAAAVSSTQVSLTWSEPAPIAGTVIYSLERQAGDGSFALIGEVQDATSFLDTGLLPGTAYSYRVTARGYAGASAASVVASAATLAAGSVEAAAMPTDSMQLWLKADTGLGTGGLDTWPDQSGQSNHARQIVTVSQPHVRPAILNGRPVVHFDGAASEMSLPNLMSGASEGELFIVHRAAANPSGADAQGWHDFGADSGYETKKYPAANGQIFDAFGSTVMQSAGTPGQPLDQFHLYDATSKPGEWTSRINGQIFYTTTVNSVGFSTNPRLGVNSYYNQHFAGDVAEILVYSRSLSETERQAVGRYLNAKYAFLATPPSVPSAVSVQAVSPTQAAVSWNEAPAQGNASIQYTIERAGPDGVYVTIAQVANVLGFLDTGLTPGTSYTYRVTAHDWAGDSASSQTAGLTVPAASPYAAAMPSAGLKIWLRADAGLDAGGVNLWPDQSGSGNHALQIASASQPIMVPNVLNGRPVVRFDGQQSYLNLPNFLSSLNQGEMFIVHRAVKKADGSNGGWHDLGSDNPYGGKFYVTGDGQIDDDFGSTVEQFTGAPSQDVTQFHLYDAASRPGEWTSRINGALHYTTPNNVVGFSASPRLGVDSAYNQFFQGDIAEALIYDHVLTDAERNAVGQYLNDKYQFVPAPVPPTALAAAAISPTQASLTWTASFANAQTYYEIERQGPQDADFVPVAQTAQSASYIDSRLTAGAAYTYRVRTRNYAGESAYSAVANTVLPATGSAVEMPFTGLKLWLKGDAGVGAASVANWVDQSGSGSHAHQNAALSQPTLAPQTANGRPAVHFDGQQSCLNLPNLMAGASGGEMFLIHRATAAANANNGWHDFGGDSGYSVKYYANADGRIYDGFGSSVRKDTGAPALPLNQWHLYDTVSTAGEWTSRINGFVHFTTTNNAVSFNASPRFGVDSAYNQFFQGDIAEALIYDHALSSAERETVGRYLLTKYALAAAPAPPATMAAAAVSSTQGSLAWSAAGDGSYSVIYTVERKGPDGAWVTVAQLTDLTSFLDGGLQPGTTYTYRVSARNGAGSSTASQEFTLTTAAATNPDATAMPTAGLRLWLRADSGLGADGACTWPDQSGNANHATQILQIARPVLSPNALNGRPAVHFDGQNSYFNLPNFMAGATAGELFIVHRATAPAGVNNGWNDLGGDSPFDSRYFPYADGRILDSFGSTTGKNTGAPLLPLNQFHLYNVVSTASEWTSRINGGIHYQTADNTVGFSINPRLGVDSAYNQSFQGDIAELLIYDHALSDAEREAVGRYLNDKYAIEGVPAAPGLPRNSLTPPAYAISPTQVSVTWSRVAPATSQGSIIYTVERKLASDPDAGYAAVGEVTDAASYLDSTSSPDTAYCYRVRARNYAGLSAYGPVSTVATPAGSPDDTLPLDGLQLWLKADAGLGPDGLNTWLDQSGQGNHAGQTTPGTLPTVVYGAANGRPAVHFDGLTSVLNFRDFLSGLTAGELFIVHRATAAANAANGWHDLGGDSPYSSKYYPYSDGHIYDSFGSSVRQDTGVVLQPPLTQFHLYNAVSQAGEWTSRINGVLQSTTATNTVSFPRNPRLGVDSAYNLYFQGDIAEVLMFDHVLTPSERNHVAYYLGVKYLVPGMDSDGDGLTNGQEIALGTNPLKADTNGDGISDGASVKLGINPLATGGFNYTTPPNPNGGGGTPPADPNDHTPPVITLTAPADAVPLP